MHSARTNMLGSKWGPAREQICSSSNLLCSFQGPTCWGTNRALPEKRSGRLLVCLAASKVQNAGEQMGPCRNKNSFHLQMCLAASKDQHAGEQTEPCLRKIWSSFSLPPRANMLGIKRYPARGKIRSPSSLPCSLQGPTCWGTNRALS